NTDEVIKKAQEWASKLDPSDKANALPLLEILWLHQQHNVVNKDLLVQMLKSPEEHVRIAAQKVAWFWSDRESHLMPPDPATERGMEFRIGYEKFWTDLDSTKADTAHADHMKEMQTAAPAKKKDPLNKKLDLREDAVATLTIVASQLHFDV